MVRMCGACHERLADEYMQGVHGAALLAGNRDSPSCAICHREHAQTAEAERAERLVACVSCHDDPGLQVRYTLPAGRLSSYLGSYHGAAARLGDTRAADCASCHGIHLILPSSDPRSTVNESNLATTCGGCHPGMEGLGASGHFHVQPSPAHDRAVFWVKLAYQFLVCGMMLAFLSYIVLDIWAQLRERLGRTRHADAVGEEEPEYERLTLHQRIQHWVLILTFTLLIVTGLPLAFPRWDISQGVVTALGGMGVRAVVHRAAAVALTLLVGYHLAYVLFSRRGHWEFRQLLPKLRDVSDVLRMVAFFFGFAKRRPPFDRYNYIEKFEYFAVAWGSVVMITTGILLWAPHVSLSLVPKWAIDIALVVHSWEAILAFLAIIIWHMYNVHWSPATFPMSRVWLTGRIAFDEFRENHPLEYEQHLRAEHETEDEET
jgi:cytochrome b subunit of formate dehydrogenase